MSRRKERIGFYDRAVAMCSALAVFACFAIYLFVNLSSDRKEVVAHDAEELATIAATTVSSKDLEKQKNKVLEDDKKKKQKLEDEKKKLEALKKAQQKEQEDLEKLRQKKLEEEKTIALKKKKEKELKEKKRKEKERKKKEAEKERKKKEEARQERADELRRELELERSARESTTIENRYTALIKKKLNSNLIKPISSPHDAEALVNIRSDQSGKVLSTKILRSSGDYAFDQAALAAVGKSSPLPLPSAQKYAEINKALRNVNLTVN